MSAKSPFDDMIEDIKNRLKEKNNKTQELDEQIENERDDYENKKRNIDFVISFLEENDVDKEVKTVIHDTMYEGYLEQQEDEINELVSEKEKIQIQSEELKEQLSSLTEMRKDYHRDNNNLAVQKGICPFPNFCNRREYCTKDSCHYDGCSNGHPFRGV